MLFFSFRLKTSLQRCKMIRQGACPSEQSRAFSPKFPVLSQVNVALAMVNKKEATEEVYDLADLGLTGL